MTEARTQRHVTILLALVLAIALAVQLSSLFIFPAPNSLRWYGDETWLMAEARSQISTGIVRYPTALGSALAQSKGLVLSMTWLSSVLYGLPTLMASSDPVSVGRFVTALLSLVLLSVLYAAARSLGTSRSIALSASALLMATRAFFFSSHSCRTDILAGLVVLAFIWNMLQTRSNHSSKWWFGYGSVIAFLCVSSSIHLVTLLGPVALYFAMKRGAFSDLTRALSLLLGGALTIAVLVLVYVLSVGSTMLFSPHAHQFSDVLSSIPILRPFSRSVQISNLLIRSKELWTEAPIAFVAIVLSVVALLKQKFNRELAAATVIVLLSWLLLEGAEINYLIHIVPLLMLCFAVSVQQLVSRSWHSMSLLILTAAILIYFSIGALHAGTVASRLNNSNDTGVARALQKIATTWKQPVPPLVLSEPPTLERVAQAPQIRVMTDHFISLPEQEEPIDSTLTRLHVNYALLYNSPRFPKHREEVDSLYRLLMRRGLVLDRFVGVSGDIGRDYFGNSEWQDTLILIQLR